MGLLRLKGVPEQLCLSGPLFLQTLQPPLDSLLLQHELRGRKHGHALQLLYGALAQHVEAAHGFHLIPPQLNTVRVLLRQIENIDDTAPDGKLARTLHLIAFFIAHGHQPAAKPFLLQGRPQIDLYDIFLHDHAHRIRRKIYGLVHSLPILWRKTAKHVVHQIPASGLLSHPQLHPYETVMAQIRDDVLQSVMPSCAALFADAQLPRLQTDIVRDHDQLG